MAKGVNQKMKLLYLAKIMQEETDDEHSLTMPEIINHLNAYGIEANRKSVYNDIEDLNCFGIEILSERSGPKTLYHCGARTFEVAELKFLVDAIQSSKFITARKTKELIRKLEKLTSRHAAKHLEREVFVAGRIKNMDESIYYAIDAIHTALNEGKMLQFRYFRWDLSAQKEYRHEGRKYRISPWGLCWDDENYYMIGYDGEAEKIKYYRVDKMTDIRILDEKRKGNAEFKKLDKGLYTKKRFRMFDGVERTVTLKCRNNLSNVIVDQFGREVHMQPVDEDHFTVNVDVAVSNQFYGWVIALGGDAVIVKPKEAKEEMEKLLKTYLEQ
ncbi:MAG: WYL domain-containing protein [Eubacterium sp.]|nr:WYL domain-containing protein [Eubacterium sp.]